MVKPKYNHKASQKYRTYKQNYNLWFKIAVEEDYQSKSKMK